MNTQVRNNPQIWKIAEWLWDKLSGASDIPLRTICKPNTRLYYAQMDYYDVAAELCTKIINNEFTTTDPDLKD